MAHRNIGIIMIISQDLERGSIGVGVICRQLNFRTAKFREDNVEIVSVKLTSTDSAL